MMVFISEHSLKKPRAVKWKYCDMLSISWGFSGSIRFYFCRNDYWSLLASLQYRYRGPAFTADSATVNFNIFGRQTHPPPFKSNQSWTLSEAQRSSTHLPAASVGLRKPKGSSSLGQRSYVACSLNYFSSRQAYPGYL